MLCFSSWFEDAYVYLSATCPKTGAKVKVIYHDFSSNTGGLDYGDQFDYLISRKMGKNMMLIAKYSNYSADDDAANPRGSDVERVSVELDFSF